MMMYMILLMVIVMAMMMALYMIMLMVMVMMMTLYMGQFLQGGKNSCFVSLFLFTESLRLAKPYKIKLIF